MFSLWNKVIFISVEECTIESTANVRSIDNGVCFNTVIKGQVLELFKLPEGNQTILLKESLVQGAWEFFLECIVDTSLDLPSDLVLEQGQEYLCKVDKEATTEIKVKSL